MIVVDEQRQTDATEDTNTAYADLDDDYDQYLMAGSLR